jgi:serine/threonine-protein kinase RsbW
VSASWDARVPARLENLPALVQSLTGFARDKGFDSKLFQIELILEEVFVNICNYSYPDTAGEVEIKCALQDKRLIIEIIDSGMPFDITALPEPDITGDLADRTVGGLGVFLIKKLADEVAYEQREGKNVMRLVISLPINLQEA